MKADVEIYLYSGCSSCKQAEAILNKSKLTVTKRDLFKQPLAADEIAELYRRIDVPVKEMTSTRSRPYQALKLADQELSDDDLIGLMALHPALIRRPVIVTETSYMVGFNRLKLESLVESLEKRKVGHA